MQENAGEWWDRLLPLLPLLEIKNKTLRNVYGMNTEKMGDTDLLSLSLVGLLSLF